MEEEPTKVGECGPQRLGSAARTERNHGRRVEQRAGTERGQSEPAGAVGIKPAAALYFLGTCHELASAEEDGGQRRAGSGAHFGSPLRLN